MRFNRLDLNLLVALDALLAERSVTRAAARLNLSPSATSDALARLHACFDDELLVQVGRRMERERPAGPRAWVPPYATCWSEWTPPSPRRRSSTPP